MSTDELSAFGSLEARACAGGADADRISLRDHIVTVEIGAFQAERGITQRVSFDVVVEVTPPNGPRADDVDRILSYDTITQAISDALAAERLNLLETLAERICERILSEPQAIRVFVRIQKLDRGPGALGVEIVRSHAGDDPKAPALKGGAVLRPVVVFLSNNAIGSGNLKGWIDNLQALEKPLIFCVGMADSAAPQSALTTGQWHIDLLAIDQNAWVLAGRDKRCVVVGTKTELDWGVRNNQISVWAPSRIVLDALDGPPGDPVLLARWFALRMGAGHLIGIGVSLPETDELAVSEIPLDQENIRLRGFSEND